MQHTPVSSSNIESVGYDAGKQELEIKFKNGGTYRYAGVDARKHAALMGAKSIGAHFHQHIRGAHKATAV
jgi:hypothetical protein